MRGWAQEFLASRSVSRAVAGAVHRFIEDFEASCAPRSIDCLDADGLRTILDVKLDSGLHPNTVRKWLVDGAHARDLAIRAGRDVGGDAAGNTRCTATGRL